MKATPADEAADRMIALVIAAVYQGLRQIGTPVSDPDQVIRTAEIFRKYIETGRP